jgi:hypothetical protein
MSLLHLLQWQHFANEGFHLAALHQTRQVLQSRLFACEKDAV